MGSLRLISTKVNELKRILRVSQELMITYKRCSYMHHFERILDCTYMYPDVLFRCT